MPGTDKRKQSLYFPEDMLNEIQAEANRQDRSLSWIVQQAWRIARGEIMRFPSVNDVLSGVAREVRRRGRRPERAIRPSPRARPRERRPTGRRSRRGTA